MASALPIHGGQDQLEADLRNMGLPVAPPAAAQPPAASDSGAQSAQPSPAKHRRKRKATAPEAAAAVHHAKPVGPRRVGVAMRDDGRKWEAAAMCTMPDGQRIAVRGSRCYCYCCRCCRCRCRRRCCCRRRCRCAVVARCWEEAPAMLLAAGLLSGGRLDLSGTPHPCMPPPADGH